MEKMSDHKEKLIFSSEVMRIFIEQVRNKKEGCEGLNYFKDRVLLIEKAFEIVGTERWKEWTEEDTKKFKETGESIEKWLDSADDSEIIKNLKATNGIERGQFESFLIRIDPLRMQKILVELAQYRHE